MKERTSLVQQLGILISGIIDSRTKILRDGIDSLGEILSERGEE